MLPFTRVGNRRRRGSLTSTLGLLLLCHWMGIGQKIIKGHCSFDHYFAFTLVGCFLLDWLDFGFGVLNGPVDDTTLGGNIC